jgi:hypothetical protein
MFTPPLWISSVAWPTTVMRVSCSRGLGTAG